MDDIKDLVEERLKTLPDNVATAIKSVPWVEKVQNIGELHQLDPDAIHDLMIEVGIIVLGMEPSDNFPKNLAKNIDIDDETIEKITEEVNDQIIRPIIDLADKPRETKPENLPMVEKGEVAHEVPPSAKGDWSMPPVPKAEGVKPKISIPTPNYGYPKGQDPYREPLI